MLEQMVNSPWQNFAKSERGRRGHWACWVLGALNVGGEAEAPFLQTNWSLREENFVLFPSREWLAAHFRGGKKGLHTRALHAPNTGREAETPFLQVDRSVREDWSLREENLEIFQQVAN